MRLINLSSFQSIQKNVTTSGTPVKLSAYYVASTIAFNDNGASADTITDSASLFLKMGFRVGDRITVAGSTANNSTFEIATVTAGTVTLIALNVLATEAAGTAITLDTVQGGKVEDGVQVVVKAKAANTGTITLGPTSARALNTNTDYYSNYHLSAGQSADIQVKNLNSIWMDSTISGEGVEVLFEV